MLSMLMTTEYAPAEERRELQRLLLHIAGGDRDALAALYQRTRTARRISRRTSMCRCGTVRSSTVPPARRWGGFWPYAATSV